MAGAGTGVRGGWADKPWRGKGLRDDNGEAFEVKPGMPVRGLTYPPKRSRQRSEG
jgi:hypothetical protein